MSERGWGVRGEPLLAKRSGKYYRQTNIIAGLSGGNIIAPMVFDGSCVTALFNAWLAQFLTPQLRPGQVVVMDNAAFHKSAKTIELIEAVGCRVIFLPAYSPDLNPIEQFWANMKRWIKRRATSFDKSYDAICAFFKSL